MTNTNWQAYSGESTLSYFVQMTGLTVQNFLSAATGMGVVLALIRGFSRKSCKTIGNFWIDTTKTTLYILLPLSFILSILLVGQGVVQTFAPYSNAISLEGNEFQIPLGPAASQVAIKQLGTNGGGFFGVNSAHPFENPTPFSNYLQMISILLLPAAQVFMFGLMINARKQGLSILATMFIFFVVIFAIALKFEYSTNPNINGLLAMVGKETRF